jgi:hypothetical protein
VITSLFSRFSLPIPSSFCKSVTFFCKSKESTEISEFPRTRIPWLGTGVPVDEERERSALCIGDRAMELRLEVFVSAISNEVLAVFPGDMEVVFAGDIEFVNAEVVFTGDPVNELCAAQGSSDDIVEEFSEELCNTDSKWG